LIFVAVALFIYLIEAPIGGGSGSNSPKEEPNRRTQTVRPAGQSQAAEKAAKALEPSDAMRERDVPREGTARENPAIRPMPVR